MFRAYCCKEFSCDVKLPLHCSLTFMAVLLRGAWYGSVYRSYRLIRFRTQVIILAAEK